MKMFVFEDVDQVSHNEHSDGGLCIVANDKAHAIELINQREYVELTMAEWEDVIVYELKEDEAPRLFIFPNAGCC